MAAIVIAWMAEKGGVGKTTNVINVGSQLQKEGLNVLLVDADPNKSASSWSVHAGENAPAVVSVQANLKTDVTKLRQMFDYILIDCEGGLGKTTLDAMKIADAVIVPYQPSPLDVWGNDSLIELIKARQDVTDGKPYAALVVNAADKRTNISKRIQETLNEYDIPLLSTKTSRLVDYIETLIDGRSVVELGDDNQAAFEIRKLTKEIKALVHD